MKINLFLLKQISNKSDQETKYQNVRTSEFRHYPIEP